MHQSGLLAFVFRHGPSCTNGISEHKDQFIITGERVEGPFKPDCETPELVIIHDTVMGDIPRTYAIPRELHDGGERPMFGGNFIYTSDSRFPSDSPIKIFDRME